MWDKNNMEKSDDAEHDSLNMAALQMSRRISFFYIAISLFIYSYIFIHIFSGLILLGVIMLLNILKLFAAYFQQFYNYYKKSKSKQPKGAPKMLHFGELLCFFACLLPSIIIAHNFKCQKCPAKVLCNFFYHLFSACTVRPSVLWYGSVRKERQLKSRK